MALILIGQIASDIRGSVGGTTFARNRSGAYARNRTKPTNAPSARRTAARQIFDTLHTAYRVTLTTAQRNSWLALAAASLSPNRLGQPHHLSALNHFIAVNSARIQVGAAQIVTAPVAPAIAPAPVIVTATGAAPNRIDITALTPVTAAGDWLLVQVSPPKSQGVNFYKGPWGPIQPFDTADVVPFSIVVAADYLAGARYFYSFRALSSVGRLSTQFFGHQDT